MLIGQIVGTIVATQKDEELEGLTLLLVKGADSGGKIVGPTIVAVDSVGAGVGELVLYAAGSSARQTTVTKNRPVDHVIMAIVDTIMDDGAVTYDKGQS